VIPRLLGRIPAALGAYNGSEHRWTFNNAGRPTRYAGAVGVGTPGSTLQLGYIARDSDVAQYTGSEYLLQAWDQLEQHTEFQYRELRARLRVARDLVEAGARPRSIGTANPGGRGHHWIRARWIDPAPTGVLWRPAPTEDDLEPGIRLFVPAKPSDNPHLDPGYVARLRALPPDRRRALLDGDWDIFSGARFAQFRRAVHVVDPARVPVSLAARRGLGVDYGGTAPFAALWGAVLGDDLVVIYRELYVAGLTPSQQAARILAAEDAGERAPERPVPLWIDPSTYARGPGQPTAEPEAAALPPPGSIAYAYRQAGLPVRRANNARIAGWAAVDEALTVRADGWPRLLVYPHCLNLIRTLPALMRDDKNPEDVDTDGEDHCGDALRYLLLGLLPHKRRPEAAQAPGTGGRTITADLAAGRRW